MAMVWKTPKKEVKLGSYKMSQRELCPNRDNNLKECPCNWPGCPRKGICCECIKHHREHGDLPACLR